MTKRIVKNVQILGAVNALGIFLYIVAASFSWRIPQEESAVLFPATAGSALVWTSSAFPLLILAVIANTIWIIALVKTGNANRNMKRMLVLVALAWTIAIIIDFWHH